MFATKSHLVKHMKSHNPPKKKNPQRQGVTSAKVNNVGKENRELVTVTENTTVDANNVDQNITLDVEVPLEVKGELILQDDSDLNAELLVVNNSQNNYPITNNDICLNSDSINIINNEGNYESDMKLVTVNEVSISASTLEGTTVKLYQLDQSLLQIHSSGGQLTISKITSK